MSELADKIAANVSPLHPLVLETKNISGLSSSQADNVRAALESELKNRSFRLVPLDSAGAAAQSAVHLQLTLSEGAQGYVLTTEIQNTLEPKGVAQIAIVAAPKSTPGTDQRPDDSLSLDKRLIYQQPGQFLDFALLSPDSAGNPSLLAILEPRRIAYYRFQDGSWQLSQAIPITPSQQPPRDLRGLIENDGKHIFLSYARCAGELPQAETMKCLTTGVQHDSPPGLDTDLGIGNGGDDALLGSVCDGGAAAVVTGAGDWTQTDSIQGYESTNGRFSASGAPIETEGPVISITQGSAPASARAVIYNLKNKNYEAYIVTATCSH